METSSFWLSLWLLFATAGTVFCDVLAIPRDVGPRRIVSASITSDEILWDLLKTPEERKRILAFSPLVDNDRYSHIVKEAKAIPKRFPASAEGIVSLKSDLVILTSFNNPSYRTILKKINTPVLELNNFSKLTDIAAHISTIGEAIGKTDAGYRMRKDFEADLMEAQPKANNKATPKKPTVLMYSTTGNAMAGDTIFDDMVRHCGGVNLASRGGQKGWPQINAEAVLKLRPDFVVISDSDEAAFKTSNVWQMLRATKCQRIIKIPAATLWSSSHKVAAAVQKICEALSSSVQTKC